RGSRRRQRAAPQPTPNGSLHQTAVTRPAALDDDQVRLGDVLPEAPGTGTSSALDILWRHYAAASPPLRVKVVAVEPRSETEVQIEAIDETAAYYEAAVSDLTVDLPTLHRDWPAVVDIRISEHLVGVGEYQLVEIVAALTVEGDWRGGTVTASLDDGPVRTVGQPGPGELEARWNEPPSGTLTVRAAPGSAAAPAGRAHEVVHVIAGPPFPVEAPGGAEPASYEIAIFQKRTKGGANPALPALTGAGAATFDHDGEPETPGFLGRVGGIGSWSRAFPAYDALTEEVVCAQIVATSEDAFSGTWSAIRVCENPADLNTVFARSGVEPDAIPDGPARVPAGTADTVGGTAGDDPVWTNTGHRNALSNTWKWFGWVRAEGIDGTGAAYFEQGVYEEVVRVVGGDLDDASATFDPNPATTMLRLIDGDGTTEVTVSVSVAADGVTPTLSGDDAADFEIV
ncbi:MAG: hypothetical protein OXI50_02945, partial [Gammaproteobacteria bacterium]|nr:hypothetical protein [Gammaproteobacteria bacterium]